MLIFCASYDWFCAALQLGYYRHTIAGNQSLFIVKMASMKRGRKVALESQFNKITGYLSDATSIVHNILDQVIERCDEPQLVVQTIVNDMLHKIGTVRCIVVSMIGIGYQIV